MHSADQHTCRLASPSAVMSRCRNFEIIGSIFHFHRLISDLLQGPELLSKYVGESERAVREVRSHS